VEELLRVLDGRDHWARVEALEKLGALGDAAALPHLADLLEDERECRHTRGAAIASVVALRAAESPELLRALKRTLLYDEDAEVRTAAAAALGELGFRGAAGALRHVATRGEDPDLARAAAHALAKLG
jgi:HEAT repeat protein